MAMRGWAGRGSSAYHLERSQPSAARDGERPGEELVKSRYRREDHAQQYEEVGHCDCTLHFSGQISSPQTKLSERGDRGAERAGREGLRSRVA